ncbi:MAG: hypothetical protein AB1443_00290 [Pseudomonadota bacterium]
MYARIHFVSSGSRERYSWVIDTERETVNHWHRDHPEAEELSVMPLDDRAGLEALYWQKCLYHDVFFAHTTCPEVRASGLYELMEILDLASRLPTGRASELWDRCMAFRFGSDPMANQPLIFDSAVTAPVEQGSLRAVPPAPTFGFYARSAANDSRVTGVRVVSAR